MWAGTGREDEGTTRTTQMARRSSVAARTCIGCRDVPRALVTGVSGQDGSYLAALLRRPRLRGRRPGRAGAPASAARRRVGRSRGDLLRPGHAARRRRTTPGPTSSTTSPRRRSSPTRGRTRPRPWPRSPTATATLLARRARGRPRPCACGSRPRARSSATRGRAHRPSAARCARARPTASAKLAAHGLVGAMRERYGLFACSGLTYNHESPRRPEHFLTRKVTRGAAAIKLGLERRARARRPRRGARLVARRRRRARPRGWRSQADEPGDYVIASGVGRTVRDFVAAAFARARPRLGGPRPRRPAPSCARPSRSRWWATRRAPASAWAGRPSARSSDLVAEMVAADLAALRR